MHDVSRRRRHYLRRGSEGRIQRRQCVRGLVPRGGGGRCGRGRVRRLKPAVAEVEQADDEDGEEQGAVDAWPVQEVGCGDEEDEVDGGGVGAAGLVSTLRGVDMQGLLKGELQEEEDGDPAAEAEHGACSRGGLARASGLVADSLVFNS